MSKIKIKNFGPIKEGMLDNDGWIEVKKVTVFIGNQGSGKSTVAKVFSTFSWLEKAINRGDFEKGKVTFNMIKNFLQYQKIQSYFKNNTYIEYSGEKYHILCDRSKQIPMVTELKGNSYIVPKIMYVPSERNFLSTIKDAFDVRGLPDNLFTFGEELRKAQKESVKKVSLPLKGYSYEYDENEDLSYVIGDEYRISIIEAASGFQSFIPLFLVSKKLASLISKNQEKMKSELTVTQSVRFANEIMEIMNDNTLTDKEKSKLTKSVRARYFNKCFINIVEEPEQNLFPTSQQQMLNSLMEFNNHSKGNKLIMTTHSPYLINYLTLAVKAENIYNTLAEKGFKLSDPEFSQTNEIVPMSSTVVADDLAIYELNDKKGTIKALGKFEGIPSDKNYLNVSLGEVNRLYDSLLEIEEEL
ncbi:MAG: AAA family ATPase [Bacteroidales bacterium]|nr:AAA family ATPase [Bacteroidales bacterium]